MKAKEYEIEPENGRAKDRIDYNKLIDTEIGKEKFWTKWGNCKCLTVEMKCEIIDYINAKCKIYK